MCWYSCDGRQLGYAQYGQPDGAPIVYFHGHPGSRLEARLAHEAAAGSGFRVIALDRPGYGLSDFQPGRAIADWPADVAEAADALGIGRFSVAGSADDLHRGRLARAVGAEKPVDLALTNVEPHVVNGEPAAEALPEPRALKHGWRVRAHGPTLMSRQG